MDVTFYVNYTAAETLWLGTHYLSSRVFAQTLYNVRALVKLIQHRLVKFPRVFTIFAGLSDTRFGL